MEHMQRRILVIIIGLWVLFFVGVNMVIYQEKEDAMNPKQHFLIGASYMTMNNEFYKIVNEQIAERVEAEGDKLILRDPALSSKRQIKEIESMLDMGVNLLVITPVDWNSLTDVLKKAKKRGVYVVIVDSNVKDESLVDCTITSDNYMAGKIVGEYFLTQCKEANLLVMKQENAKSGRDRVKGFVDAISVNENINIVGEIECEGQLEIAMPKLKNRLGRKRDFDQIFCLNDLAAVGCVAALDEKNLLDKVGVYGVDASPDSKALIKEGMMNATAAQFPSKIGQSAAEEIYLLLNGKKVSKNILIPVELVNKENVDAYGIERWQ